MSRYPKPTKEEFRIVYKEIRLDQPLELSEKACENLISYLGEGTGKYVALYVSMLGEVQAETCANALAKNGWKLCLPRVKEKNKPLVFNAWAGDVPVDRDLLNIPCTQGNEVTPHVVVVPLVAFDDYGTRIGMGAGYYDRTLHLLENTKAVGLAFHAQKGYDLPYTLEDKPLNAAVTEKETLEIKPL